MSGNAPDDAAGKAHELVGRLRDQGHDAQAEHLAGHLARTVERPLLYALREACETVLTAIEAIDPVTQTMIEDLRASVESHLGVPEQHPDKQTD